MKFTAKIYLFISLGWIMLCYILGVKFLHLENWTIRWNFTRPVFERSPIYPLRNLKSRIIQDSSSIFFSVKTTPAYYKSRLDVLKATWFQMVDRDKLSIVSDYVNGSFHEEKLFEAELIKENFKLVLTRCVIAHKSNALCCKSGAEYKQFYDYLKNHSDGQNQVKWYCHFDDDVYVNVEGLSKLLSQYDSSMPYYIGRNPRGPYGMKVDRHRLNSLKRNYHVNKTSYLYAAGAAYCNSLELMKELYKYFSDPERFEDTCERTKTTDDLTIGAIIDMVLNHTLTNIENMYSQAASLKHLNMANLTKMITLSYRTSKKNQQIVTNIDPQPRIFTTLQDPTRFLTFHCLLYYETSWCQADSQVPSNNQIHLQNVGASSDQTSSGTVRRVLSQTSDEKLVQQLETTSTVPLHNDLVIKNEQNSKAISFHKSDHSDSHQSEASMTTAADNQDYLNTIPKTGQTDSHTSNDETLQAKTNRVDSLASDQVLTRQSQAKRTADETPSSSQAYLQSLRPTNDRDSNNL